MITLAFCILLVFLILLSGFLSGAETSLFSLSSMKLKSYRHSKDSRLNLIGNLMSRPRDVLVTILMLNVLANILVQNTVANLFEDSNSWVLKVWLPLGLTLVFGELLPKSLAMPNNEKISYLAAPWVSKASNFLGPLRVKLTQITSYISRVFFLVLRDEEDISFDELRHVLKTSEASGVLMKQESRLIGGALDLQKTKVLEHMRPREDILFYDLLDPVSTLVSLFADQQISRLPVCEGGLNNVKGVLSVQQFFLLQNADVRSLLEKPYYIPETTKAWALLQAMRDRRESMALVVDEYDSISGLITQEDLIEAMVGEIKDRRDNKSLYIRSGEGAINASGKLELTEFNEIFGVELKSKEHSVTLGGYLIEQMGKIPQAGEQYVNDQFHFLVLQADPNRVRQVKVTKLKRKA